MGQVAARTHLIGVVDQQRVALGAS
jgi:hypothetical protein